MPLTVDCMGIAAKKFSRYLAARKAVPKCVSADWIKSRLQRHPVRPPPAGMAYP